jgi:hypothetical protein
MITLTESDKAEVEDWIRQYRSRLVTKNSLPNYGRWGAMHQRCRNPNCKGWQWYGGRGIYIDERWYDFLTTYFQDIGIAPEHCGVPASLNRVDNDGPYAPENVEWTWAQEQCANRRRPADFSWYSVITPHQAGLIKGYLAQGRSVPWTARKLGIAYHTVYDIYLNRYWKAAPRIDPPEEPNTFVRRI